MKSKLPQSLDGQSQFNGLVAAHPFVIVLFTAKWCAPCQQFAPVFAELASQSPQALFAVADIDTATDLAANFQVTQVPALMVIRDRVVIDRVIGAMHAHALRQHVQMWQALEMTAINRHFAQKAPLHARPLSAASTSPRE